MCRRVPAFRQGGATPISTPTAFRASTLQPIPRLLQTLRVQADGLDQRAPRLRGRQQEVLGADHVIAPGGTDLFRGTENDRPGLGRELLEHLYLPCFLCTA